MRTNIIRHESLLVSWDVVGGWTVVEIDGEVDAHTAPLIRDAVLGLVGEGHHHFVLDLGFVTFMDSTGLGLLVAVTKRIRAHEGSLRIASVPGRILRIFELSGISESYRFFGSIAEATRDAPASGGLADWPQGHTPDG
jgi:anti-sigma B factor antagonist